MPLTFVSKRKLHVAMPYILDDKSNFPKPNASIEEYARACSDAVDKVLSEWPVVETTENGKVSTGFIGDNKLRSTLWTQSFDVAMSEDNTDNGGHLLLDDLLSSFKDIFSSDDLAKHAKEWDATFAGAEVVAKLSENDETILVRWKFDASPLSGRDMLYLVHRLEETTNEKNPKQILRMTYAYASVSDEWVKNTTRNQVNYVDGEDRVRSMNCFPSCDRITVCTEDPSSGVATVTVDHLLTTDLGGRIGPFLYNNFFKTALIQANAHECEAMRKYALSLCKANRN